MRVFVRVIQYILLVPPTSSAGIHLSTSVSALLIPGHSRRWARSGGQPLRVGGRLPAPLLSIHPQPTGCPFSSQAKCAHCTLPVCSLDPQSTEHFPQRLCWEPSGTNFHQKEPHSPSLLFALFLHIRIFVFLPFISLLTTRFPRHSQFNHNQTLVFVRPDNNVRPQCCLDNVREHKFLFYPRSTDISHLSDSSRMELVGCNCLAAFCPSFTN